MGKTIVKAPRLYCKIDVTAFASVLFALLAIFLFPALVVTHPPERGVGLATVSHPRPMPGALKEDALLVAVLRDGSIFVGSDRMIIQRLPTEVRNRLSRGTESKAYIRADARARYGDVLNVLNALRSAGIENIGFIVEQRRASIN